MAFMLHQACRTLAAWNTGPHTVGCQLPQGYVLVETGTGTRRSTLIKHKATVHGAAHHCRQRGKPCHRGPQHLFSRYAILYRSPCALPAQTRVYRASPPFCTVPSSNTNYHHPLTTECRAPPDRSHPSLATMASVGFQDITETSVS